MTTSRSQIRRKLRKIRKSLSVNERETKTNETLVKVLTNRRYRSAKRVAFYSAFDGEVDLSPLLLHAYHNNKQCFLPVLPKNKNKPMRFALYHADNLEQTNVFGISEPKVDRASLVSANQLDLVLMPLVAFDKSGQRLGMGGGYYDRCFNFRLNRTTWRKPFLIGIAFQFQQCHLGAKQAWDVSLDACITDQNEYIF